MDQAKQLQIQLISSLVGRIEGKRAVYLKMKLIRGNIGIISYNYLGTFAFQSDLYRKRKMKVFRLIDYQIQPIRDGFV